jgi:hypothetical protein
VRNISAIANISVVCGDSLSPASRLINQLLFMKIVLPTNMGYSKVVEYRFV